ncbi:MAG: glycosyltransferase family 2 protein [Acidobacteriia bacterium]|nr:glycosyltransferase family 2 protein [Terriglobia bacterium]
MAADRPPKISVVIPVFNEMATIEEILLRVQAVELEKEIVIVDDGSTDGTRGFLADLARCARAAPARMTLRQSGAVLRADNICVLFQDKNQGKGAALRRGFQKVRGEIVIIQDADLEYDPADYHRLIAPIEAGRADVVYGSRFLGGPHRVLFFWHYVGNKLLTTISGMVTNLNLSDVWTCYKAFRREILLGLDLRENRFGFEQEITIKIAQAGWRVYEIPVAYHGRTYAEGKKITWRDGVRAIWCILRYSFLAASSKAPQAKPVVQPTNRGNEGKSAQ